MQAGQSHLGDEVCNCVDDGHAIQLDACTVLIVHRKLHVQADRQLDGSTFPQFASLEGMTITSGWSVQGKQQPLKLPACSRCHGMWTGF